MKTVKFIFVIYLLIVLSFISSAQKGVEDYNLENPTFLDSTLNDYDLFFTAEMHWRKENVDRKKNVIKYLSERNSLDVIVVERSYAFGHWINYYMETGDTLFLKEYLLLDDFFSTKKGVIYEDEYRFYKWLRQFNLENNKTVKIVGIDMAELWEGELTLWSFLKFTEQNLLLQEKFRLDILKAKELMLKDKISISNIKKWLNNVNISAGKTTINDTHFLNYLYNLNQSIKWARGNKMSYRDKEIAINFERYIPKGKKVYGQYGAGHIMLKSGKGERLSFKAFTSILKERKEYKGKILSIGLICFDCNEFGEFPGDDLYIPFLTKEEFLRLRPQFLKLPHNTLLDLRETNELIKEYCQLLLIEYD